MIWVPALPPRAYLVEWTEPFDRGDGVDTLHARTWILRRSSDAIRLESQAGLGVIFVGERGNPVYLTAVGLPFPNPTPEGIRLQISLEWTADFELRIFDVLGRQMRAPLAMRLLPGSREISWNGMGDNGPLPSGVFLLRLEGPGRRFERRIILARDLSH